MIYKQQVKKYLYYTKTGDIYGELQRTISDLWLLGKMVGNSGMFHVVA